MHKNLLIASLIIIVLGFVVSGIIGSILLGVGVLLLIYVLFSRESHGETEPQYIEPDYNKKPSYQQNKKPMEKKSTARYVEEPKPKYKNADRAKRELKAWDSSNKGKKCPSCGSTGNPNNARFCADCGQKL